MNPAENASVGAGPAGLQIGRLLQKRGREFTIFERNAHAGSFYEKFPRHRTLISLNKRHTGRSDPEFNLRHDWNSLLENDEVYSLRRHVKPLPLGRENSHTNPYMRIPAHALGSADDQAGH